MEINEFVKEGCLDKVDSWDEYRLPTGQEICGTVRNCHIAKPYPIVNTRNGKRRMEYSIDVCFNDEQTKEELERDMREIAEHTWGSVPYELTSIVRLGEFAGYPEKYYVHLTSIFQPVRMERERQEGTECIATFILKPFNGKYKRAILTNLCGVYDA